MFEKFVSGTLTPTEIFGLDNAEQKAALIQEIGYEKIMEEIKDAVVVDTQTRCFNKNPDKPVKYELFEYSLANKLPMRCIKVEWWEKNRKRQTVLGVPRTINDAIEAVAWTCHKTREEWEEKLVKEA